MYIFLLEQMTVFPLLVHNNYFIWFYYSAGFKISRTKLDRSKDLPYTSDGEWLTRFRLFAGVVQFQWGHLWARQEWWLIFIVKHCFWSSMSQSALVPLPHLWFSGSHEREGLMVGALGGTWGLLKTALNSPNCLPLPSVTANCHY